MRDLGGLAPCTSPSGGINDHYNQNVSEPSLMKQTEPGDDHHGADDSYHAPDMVKLRRPMATAHLMQTTPRLVAPYPDHGNLILISDIMYGRWFEADGKIGSPTLDINHQIPDTGHRMTISMPKQNTTRPTIYTKRGPLEGEPQQPLIRHRQDFQIA